jgi:hypothetical protein
MTAKPIPVVRLSEIATLCELMQHWYNDELASEQACVSCESSMHTPSDLEPTALYDLCAQRLEVDVPELLAERARLHVDLGETRLVLEQQDRDLTKARARIAALEAGLPEIL